jgi:hypothetical protein
MLLTTAFVVLHIATLPLHVADCCPKANRGEGSSNYIPMIFGPGSTCNTLPGTQKGPGGRPLCICFVTSNIRKFPGWDAFQEPCYAASKNLHFSHHGTVSRYPWDLSLGLFPSIFFMQISNSGCDPMTEQQGDFNTPRPWGLEMQLPGSGLLSKKKTYIIRGGSAWAGPLRRMEK